MNALLKKLVVLIACFTYQDITDWKSTYRKAKLVNYSIQRFNAKRVKWVLNYIEVALGGNRSFSLQQSVDNEQNPIPWYTFPAIEYIKQIDFSKFHVFEYGSGNSSIFWAKRAAFLTSVESDPGWFELVNQKLSSNQRLLLKAERSEYINAVHLDPIFFDLIIIDGLHRFNCAIEATKKLNKGGFIILDNADWHPKTTQFLRENGFFQIDFIGAGPINSYAWCTSFFFKSDQSLPRTLDSQGMRVTGGIAQISESDAFYKLD